MLARLLLNLLISILAMTVANGQGSDINAIGSELKKILSLPDSTEKIDQQTKFLADLEGIFLRDWLRWPPEVFAKNAELLPLATDLDPDRWLPLTGALHLLAPEPSPFIIPARIRRAKTAPTDTESPKGMFVRKVVADMTAAIESADCDSIQREAVAVKLLENKGFMAALVHVPEWHRNWLAIIETRQWISKETLVKRAPDFAKVAPRDGWAWCEAARLSASAGKHADALHHWNSALPFAQADALRYSTFRLGQLETFFQLKLQGDAAKAIKAFDVEKLHPDFKARWDALQKELKIRPADGTPLV